VTREVAFDTPWGEVFKQDPDAPGYDKKTVPLGGRYRSRPSAAAAETDGLKDCGCAFGQCALGLIF
jgi:hypothetical protein